MAPHSSTPAWKIPWMEEPARLQSMGSLSSLAIEGLPGGTHGSGSDVARPLQPL